MFAWNANLYIISYQELLSALKLEQQDSEYDMINSFDEPNTSIDLDVYNIHTNTLKYHIRESRGIYSSAMATVIIKMQTYLDVKGNSTSEPLSLEPTCSCPIRTIMMTGCVCPRLKWERNQK